MSLDLHGGGQQCIQGDDICCEETPMLSIGMARQVGHSCLKGVAAVQAAVKVEKQLAHELRDSRELKNHLQGSLAVLIGGVVKLQSARGMTDQNIDKLNKKKEA